MSNIETKIIKFNVRLRVIDKMLTAFGSTKILFNCEDCNYPNKAKINYVGGESLYQKSTCKSCGKEYLVSCDIKLSPSIVINDEQNKELTYSLKEKGYLK